MPSARIFKPARTAMQSGRAKTKEWVLEFEPRAAKRADPLMGWAGSRDTLQQVTLKFDNERRGDGLRQAARHRVHGRDAAGDALKPRAYADNFSFDRVGCGRVGADLPSLPPPMRP